MSGFQTPIKLFQEEFNLIRQDIIEKEGITGTFTQVLKRNQGWTWRQPYRFDPVSIDFWNDSAKSMFLLKYSHLIVKSLKLLNKNTG